MRYVPKAHDGSRTAVYTVFALVITLLAAGPAFSQLPAITVTVGIAPEVHTIVVNPGYLVTLRFDRPITLVRVGNPALLTVSFGGWMSRDVTLSANGSSGETNLHIWAGDTVTLWQVIVSTSVPRTPELVLVRIKGRLPPPERLPTVEARGGERVLVAELTREGIVATFSLERMRWGVALRYRLRNLSSRAYRLNPSLAVVWADGKVVQFALLREVAGLEPDVLLPSSSESGVFTVMKTARTIRLILPLYPDGGKTPVWFEPLFSGVDRLEVGN